MHERKVIVFLHGFLGDGSDWDGMIRHFRDNYLSITPSLNDIKDLTTWGRALPKGSHLVGYSMGGRIALWLLSLLPDHFASASLLSANPGLTSEQEREERIASDKEWIRILTHEPIDSFLKKWYSQDLFAKSPIPATRNELKSEEMIHLLQKFSIAKQPSFWDTAPTLSAQTLFLFGEEDTKYKQIGERIKRSGGHAKFIPKCTHAIHLENPEACAREIKTHVEVVNASN